MANAWEPDAAQLKSWAEWCETRPCNVRRVAEKCPPWKLFRMDTGHRVTVTSYQEREASPHTVSVTVAVTGEYNRVRFARQVFGIDPDELEECDLPGDDEELGEEIARENVPAYLKLRRERERGEKGA